MVSTFDQIWSWWWLPFSLWTCSNSTQRLSLTAPISFDLPPDDTEARWKVYLREETASIRALMKTLDHFWEKTSSKQNKIIYTWRENGKFYFPVGLVPVQGYGIYAEVLCKLVSWGQTMNYCLFQAWSNAVKYLYISFVKQLRWYGYTGRYLPSSWQYPIPFHCKLS